MPNVSPNDLLEKSVQLYIREAFKNYLAVFFRLFNFRHDYTFNLLISLLRQKTPCDSSYVTIY